ncbi:RNA methyltransferase [Dokdonella sp.]|uniref:RNA methyltransferase n=1 Tax=Dokdonella sp. TaxID=2291710 RepID=UPI0031BECA88|nr:RNA methyltransferase [Dokdonella sp.]
MNPSGAFERIRIVLVRTSHPGNIGAAARALGTMGLSRLALVAPHSFPHAEASALAACAGGLLETAKVTRNLDAAVADCTLIMGATARRRGVALPELDPREAALAMLAAAQAGREVAVLFGNERNGLDNDEIQHCHAAITIPSNPACPSLNLAQAVQVVAWELRMAALGRTPAQPVAPALTAPPEAVPASAAEMEGFFAHLAQALDEIDFHKGRSPRTILARLRRLFLRARPDSREVHVLRGILADVIRTARIAHGK